MLTPVLFQVFPTFKKGFPSSRHDVLHTLHSIFRSEETNGAAWTIFKVNVIPSQVKDLLLARPMFYGKRYSHL